MFSLKIPLAFALVFATPLFANEAAITQVAEGRNPQAAQRNAALATPLDISSLAPSPSASSGATNLNNSQIVQSGVRNSATVLQGGGGNQSSVLQQGSGNVAIVSQFNRR